MAQLAGGGLDITHQLDLQARGFEGFQTQRVYHCAGLFESNASTVRAGGAAVCGPGLRSLTHASSCSKVRGRCRKLHSYHRPKPSDGAAPLSPPPPRPVCLGLRGTPPGSPLPGGTRWRGCRSASWGGCRGPAAAPGTPAGVRVGWGWEEEEGTVGWGGAEGDVHALPAAAAAAARHCCCGALWRATLPPPPPLTHRQQPPGHHLLHARVNAAVQLDARAVQEEGAAVVVGGRCLVQVLLCISGGKAVTTGRVRQTTLCDCMLR